MTSTDGERDGAHGPVAGHRRVAGRGPVAGSAPGPAGAGSSPVPVPVPVPVGAAGRPWASTVLLGAVVVSTGLAVTAGGSGRLADAAGDALYAVLVLLAVRFLVPRRAPWQHAAVALAVCVVVELAQLTGGPAAAVRAWPPVRYVLGTTFVATDLLAYAAGAVLGAACLAAGARVQRRHA